MPRSGPQEADDTEDEPSYPILTNRPGVVAVDPVHRVRVAAVLFCLALFVSTIAGAWIATTTAANESEERVKELRDESKTIADSLRRDMDRRTAERRASEARAGAILEQNRRTLCSLMRDLRDRDQSTAEIEQLYVAYHCGTAKEPIVPPGWVPPPGWPALPPGPWPRLSRPPTAPTTPAPGAG